ncbi:DUF6270 domain-containing protein [Cellulosimicrobium funkei]
MNVFAYGSSTALETARHLSSADARVIAHVERQSLVSAYSPPIPSIDDGAEPLADHVLGDRRSSLMPTIAEHASDLSILLWDLHDEIWGVARSAGSTTTLNEIPPDAGGADGTVLRFGAEDHFLAWRTAAESFVRDLRALGVLSRVRVLAVGLARRREDGHPTLAPDSLDIEAVNTHLSRYHEHLRALGLAVITVPEVVVRSSSQHPRGDGPTSYAPAVYAHLARQVEALSAAPGPRPHGWDSLVDPWVDALPIKAEKLPSAYRIWQSAHRYFLAGDLERAEHCVQLNKLIHNSQVPAELRLGKDVLFGYGGMGVVLHKDCEIEDGVTIASQVTLGGNGHPTRWDERLGRRSTVPSIGRYAVLSAGARVLGGVRVGAFAIVAPNSVVTRDVAAGAIVAGAPAREIGRVDASNALRYRAKYLPLRRTDDATFMSLFSAETQGTELADGDEPT